MDPLDLVVVCVIGFNILLVWYNLGKGFYKSLSPPPCCPVTVSVEGNIGAGKSTLLNTLKTLLPVAYTYVDEPLEEWDTIRDTDDTSILERFYQRPATYAFPFQILACSTRANRLRNTQKQLEITSGTERQAIIMERSFETDQFIFMRKLYDDGFITYIQKQIYDSFVRNCAVLLWFNRPSVNAMIYVRTTPTVCLHRIAMRNRSGEDKITLEYLSAIHANHEAMIAMMSDQGIPILVLDGDKDTGDYTRQIVEFVQRQKKISH